MIESGTLDRGRMEVKLGRYAVGPATVVPTPHALAAAQDYRRGSASRMIPVGIDDLSAKVPTADYHVSRKLDGEFTLLCYAQGEVFSINPGGTVRVGLPWMDEVAQLLEQAQISQALIAGELYVVDDGRRTRVHDVTRIARSPATEEELEQLHFAPFDIVELNDESPSDEYAGTFQTLESLFGESRYSRPVETRVLSDIPSIRSLFSQWVEQENSEGLVLRSDSAGQFKLKPRLTLDVAVIGFTESGDDRQGMLHDLLVAVMRKDGSLHVLTRVGGGFSDEQRRSLLSDLKDRVVDSEYVEVNSDYVAYQMVRPEWVVEISCLDLIAQTTRGGNVNRMVIAFDEKAARYSVVRRMPLASVISPQFLRQREDKQVSADDVRIQQISSHVEVALADADAHAFSLPNTEIIKREVFTKQLKGKTMVRKFVLLQTNKEKSSDEYPAFVMHYTDFSPNRSEPLQREVVVSNSRDQILALYLEKKQANVKKGWQEAQQS